MKNFILISFLLFGPIIFSVAQDKNNLDINNKCLSCHVENDYMPEDFSEYDLHFQTGLLCSDCHGGDPTLDDEELGMSKLKGFVGIPEKKEVSYFCGKCHSNIEYMKKYRPRIETDQVARYLTSGHGKQLLKGDRNVAVCTSCHTAHSILAANDPRSTTYALNLPKTCDNCHGNVKLMEQYNLDSKVFEDYANGVHGVALFVNKDIGAPSCNDCHGNHGAAPPGVNSIANVCGICHVNNVNYFKQSSMAESFEELDFHGCEECHSNHNIKKPDDNLVGIGTGANCIECHDEGDKGYSEADKIHVKLKSLSKLYDSAHVKLLDVKNKGMNDIEIDYLLKEVNQSLIQARTLVHTFDSKKVGAKANEGVQFAREALSKGNSEIEKYKTRRNGLGAATLFLTILIIALYFKIKDITKKKT